MEKQKMGIARFFTGYLKNLHKILLTNILFAVPLAGFTALFFWLNSLLHPLFDMVLFLAVIFVYPFFAGVTAVTRNIAREDEDVRVIKTYFSAIRDNLKYFIVHGVVLYFAIFFSYASLTYYWKMAQSNSVFLGVFIVTAIIVLAAVFVFYSVPVMTVTFDLSLKDIYKNSFLMSFGELKNNLLASLGLFLLALFCATIFITVPSFTILLITMAVLALLVIPATASFIINFYIFKDMMTMIGEEAEPSDTDDVISPSESVKLDFSSLDLDEKKDGEEYLFFNGKMIKRKVLIKMRDRQENENE